MPPDDDGGDDEGGVFTDLIDDETLAVLGSTIDWLWERIRALPRAEVPRALVPMLGFRRLSGPAKRQIVRAIDDDAFRQTVANGSDEADLPALGVLWLERPEGWQDRFVALHDDAQRRQAEIARVDLERRQRTEIERLEAALQKTVAERDQAIESRDEYRRRYDELRRSTETLRTDADRLRRASTRLEKERRRAVDELQAARALADRRLDELKNAEETTAQPVESSQWQGLDPHELAAAIDQRRRGTQAALETRLSEVVGELVADVNRSFGELIDSVQASAPDTVPADPNPAATAKQTRGTDSKSRRPVKLPGGVFEDSAEAASFLLRAADLWLIDGYNMSMRRWPDASVEQQREWLVRRLDSVGSGSGAGAGTTMRIIFDGADGDYFRGAGQRRFGGGVEVDFSPVGVEADDVILGLCATEPAQRAIVVVSNDRRVRDGARRLGANIVDVDQLFALSTGE